MKVMRRIVASLLVIGMILSFVACGGSEKSVTLQFTDNTMWGITVTETKTLNAKGDTIQKMTDVVDVDFSLSAWDDIAGAENLYNMVVDDLSAKVDVYNLIDGCTASEKYDGTAYRWTITVDCTGDAPSELEAHGLVKIEDSLKTYQEALESVGYTVVE